MSHFAEIDSNNIVQRVLVIDQENINTGVWGSPDNWIQTSYNTRGGLHYAPNSITLDSGVPLRKNYAGVGFTYDKDRDAFIAPQPFASWVLNDNTCQWNAPVACPADGKMYTWDENNTEWKEI